jgi:ABC-type transport system substrate-binding protein
MKVKKISLIIILIFVTISGCQAEESTIKRNTEQQVVTTNTAGVPTDLPTLPSATATSQPIATPTPNPTQTPLPTPTALPGVELIEISKFKDDIPWLDTDNNYRPVVHYIGFNTKKIPFNDPLVRQAFVAAIDRNVVMEIIKPLWPESSTLATNFTPREAFGRDLTGAIGIPFDPQNAKNLLKKAGYSDPNSFPPVKFLVTVSASENPGVFHQMAESLVKQWKTNLGVIVTFEVLNRKAFMEKITSDMPDLFRMGWAADYNDPDNFLFEVLFTGSKNNYGGFSDPEFDKLVAKARRETNPSIRQDLYIQAERILCEELAGVMPLFHTKFKLQ